MAVFGNTLMPFGGEKLLLNFFPNATVAFSLRKLRNTYSGSVIRVRRSSDNTELDFNANEINNGTLLNWVGAGDGFVSVWYDQSGNGKNAIQTTATNQPRIVLNGVVETQQGKPAINFNFDGPFTFFSFEQQFSTPLSSYLVLRETVVNPFPYIYGAATGQLTSILILGFNGNVVRSLLNGINQDTDVNKSNYSLYTVISDTSNSLLKRNNNVIATTNNAVGTSQRTAVSIGGLTSGLTQARFSGTIQEIITYPQNQSLINAQIEANINNHYTIY